MSQEQQDDPHYKKHVTELGDTRDIVASHDIYSQNGIKLLSAGARINSTMYERIICHKLNAPLEQSLSISNPVSAADLAEHAQKILHEHPLFERMQRVLPESCSLAGAIGSVHLNAPLSFKLAVARDRMGEMFSHGVETALICAFLGHQLGLDAQQSTQLVTAGVFHDLGELHIESELLGRKDSLSMAERKHIYAHPLTIFLILQEFPDLYHPMVSTAVLEHHERLDGSGYPSGINQGKLGRLGRLLAVAEVVSSLYRSGADAERGRIRIMLKLNMHHQLDAAAIGHILSVLESDKEEAAAKSVGIGKLQGIVQKMAEQFLAWDRDYQYQMQGCTDSKRLIFLNERINMLKCALEDAGLNFNRTEMIAEMFSDDTLEALELQGLAQEFVNKVRDIEHELKRRWPSLDQPSIDTGDEFIRSWIKRALKLTAS